MMHYTDIFIIVWLLVIAVYDLWMVFDKKKNNTISHRVVLWCLKWRWLPLVLLIFVVLLCGHFFMPYDIKWLWPQPIWVAES
jgi:uncharacterized BrkB/YihY/UPF0761 family membrane protein